MEISGLTVLTGLNNTGKSTVGKALFALVEGFAQAEDFGDDFTDDLKKNVLELASPIRVTNEFLFDYIWAITILRSDNINDSIMSLNELLKEWDHRVSNLRRRFMEVALKNSKTISDEKTRPDDSEYKIVVKSIINLLQKYLDNQSVEQRLMSSLNYFFRATFDNSFSPALKPNLNSLVIIDSKIGVDDVKIKMSKNTIVYGDGLQISPRFDKVIYIEYPQYINKGDSSFSFRRARRNQVSPLDWSMNRALDLARRYLNNGYGQASLFDKVSSNIYRKRIEEITNGQLVSGEGGKFFYRQSDGAVISMSNSASGLKSFFILYALLCSEQLDSRTIIIIDEPEVNLHPAWEVEYARLIIDLVSEGYYFLINTHSPYMIKAFDTFSKQKPEARKKCFIYQMVKDETDLDMCVSRDVTDNLEPVFKDLAAPYSEIL